VVGDVAQGRARKNGRAAAERAPAPLLLRHACPGGPDVVQAGQRSVQAARRAHIHAAVSVTGVAEAQPAGLVVILAVLLAA
jgi:hypothetical protein